jgi:hypothetical protein
MFVTANFPIYEVVSFLFDDDSMFTSQLQELRLAAKASTYIKMSVKTSSKNKNA